MRETDLDISDALFYHKVIDHNERGMEMENDRNLPMRWHRVYPVLLLVYGALGFCKGFAVLRLHWMQYDFPYQVYLSTGETAVLVALILVEMGLCLFTALYLKDGNGLGCTLNKFLLLAAAPLSLVLLLGLLFRSLAAVAAVPVFLLIVSFPVLTYYKKRQECFK